MEGATVNAWPTLDLPDGEYSNEYAMLEVRVGLPADLFPVRTLAGLEYGAYSFGFFSTLNPDFGRERLVNDCVNAAVKHKWLTRAEAVVMFERAWDAGREVALLEQSLAGTAPDRACVECNAHN